MKKKSFIGTLIVLITALVLSACSGPAAEESTSGELQEPDQQPAESSNENPEEEAEAPVEFFVDEGMDLSGVDVCALLDTAEMDAVTGEEISTPPEQMITIDREKGCRFDSPSGHYYEIQLYPLDQWALTEFVLYEAQELPGVGDGAFQGMYSDAVSIRVLVSGKTVIAVRVSDENLEHALGLYELTLQSLP
ncbi:MAG: hypothetical protein JXA25_20460 [Anaerolineales bacterium]|nr:hypothetical protein [Anaerolineales bacterium]